ncbi:ABC transporter permease subunit [candidate division KSB1 bacterium]|nr:ABC transporter permease subunit [candidate division KSB1 bacterium]
MIWAVAKNEIRINMMSLKFNLLALLCLLIFIVGSYSMVVQFNSKMRDYANNKKSHLQELELQDSFDQLAIYGMKIDRPPEPMSIFASGMESVKSRIYKVNIMEITPMGGSDHERNPFVGLNGSLDILFLIKFVLSLVVILGAYDIIAKEQENSLIKLNFSFNLSRYEYILGKYLGNFMTLGAAFTISFIISTLIFIIELQASFMTEEWLRILLIYLISLTFISVFILCCLLVSSIFSSSNIALLSGMLIWMFFTIVIPYSVPYLIELFKSPPSISEMQIRLFNINKQCNENAINRIKEYYNETHERPSKEWVANLREELLIESYSDKKNIKIDYDNKLQSFLTLAKNIARISPTSAYQSCVQILSNTDINSENRFMNRLDLFQSEFMNYVNKKMSTGAPLSQLDKINLSKTTTFNQNYKNPLSVSLDMCLWDICLLIFYNMLFLVASVFIFNIKSF